MATVSDIAPFSSLSSTAHSPDNSFLGFVVSEPVPEDAKPLTKKPIGLVYGKDVEFWRVRIFKPVHHKIVL